MCETCSMHEGVQISIGITVLEGAKKIFVCSMPVMRTVWRRELNSSRLHTVSITGILNIYCHITTMDDNTF